jgi:hypothetical protein
MQINAENYKYLQLKNMFSNIDFSDVNTIIRVLADVLIDGDSKLNKSYISELENTLKRLQKLAD